MFETGLNKFLSTSPLITAILGTSRSDSTSGVFPVLAIGEATMPYLVYQRVSGKPVTSYQGANKLQEARIRLSVYAASALKAVQLAEAIKLTFAVWTGTFPDGTPVQNVTLEMEADDAEPIPHGTIYARHMDYSFQFIDQA